MDHSMMDHSMMDHSMDAGMGGGSMEAEANRCMMKMVLHWETQNLCLVFRGWQITGTPTLIASLLGVFVLSAGFELLRSFTRRFEASRPTPTLPRTSPVRALKKVRLAKAGLYGLQVFYSFFIMLLFMTYNGWIMITVALGAAAGHFIWGSDTSASRSVACH